MPAGNKKKKKPAANPARGFATTSIASKPKSEAVAENTGEENSPIAKETDPTSLNSTTKKATTETPRSGNHPNISEQTPEEYEAELETYELQNFVERFATKTKKDAARHVSRLQTEKRLLRGQAEFLSTKKWLPDELMQQILELGLADQQNVSNIQKRQILPSGNDLLSKIWGLRQCLLDFGFPVARIVEALGCAVSNPPFVGNSTSSVWGLEECFDWFALHCEEHELGEYDRRKVQHLEVSNASEDEESDSIFGSGEAETNGKPDSSRTSDDDKITTTQQEDGVEVSDIDSDLEPDELVSVYVRTKVKLFQLETALDSLQETNTKNVLRPMIASRTTPKSASQRKLEQKLKRIESDALFDRQEADARWASKKIALLREAGERKKLQLHNVTESPVEMSPNIEPKVVDISNGSGPPDIQESQEADGDDLFGGMFEAIPGDDTVSNSTGNAAISDTTSVRIRNFGRLTGLNPRRVLEEACKARDSRCKLTYNMISPTTYASRHSVVVQWSTKPQDFEYKVLSEVAVSKKGKNIAFTMERIATPEVAQSEAYIATVVLFLIFSGSPKEEKAHLRLPPAYRDLWDEMSSAKRDEVDKRDREVVKGLREIIDKESQTNEEGDEVVFVGNNGHRLGNTTGSNTPNALTVRSHSRGLDQPEELKNLWNRKTAIPAFQRMLAARKNLPIFQFRDTALETIDRHQITILCGETGCGKSTQLPAFILERELSNGRPCKIYCTQPRRISAISLAQRVSEEMGEDKGDLGTVRSLVGYAIRLESQTVAQTRLVYATTGIMLRMLENRDDINDITHLIIDEVHERSIDTDFLLIVLRTLMMRRPDLKVVLMSATVDSQKFSNYLDGAPVINVPGRTFPVQTKFLEDAIELTGHTNEDASSGVVDEDSTEDETEVQMDTGGNLKGYSRQTQKTLENYDEYRIDYTLIMKLLETISQDTQYSPFSKAILIFLPGIAEIRKLDDMLRGHDLFAKDWSIHPLHSTFSSEDQQTAFQVPPEGVRKIVLATNIAETGITIPDVTCVIDTGKHKEMRFDERRQMSRLIQSFIARANAKQRRGRAGRVQEGICFHLFTKHRHDQLMVDQQTPEILRLSLQDLAMRVKICKLGDIEHVLSQALDAPSSKNIRRAVDALVEVGALTSSEELTPLGTQLAKLPLDAQLGKVILLGSIFGCLDFALTAAATLSSKSPFINSMNMKKQADTVRLGFKRGDSDLLTVYNAYRAWRKVCTTPGLSEYKFCNKNFLSPQNFASIEDLKGQLLASLVDARFVSLGDAERSALSKVRRGSRQRNFIALPDHCCRFDENDTIATSVVAWSFYPKILTQDGKGWRNVANNQTLALHPTSVNKVGFNPDIKYMSFYSIMQSSSRFTNAQETSPVSDMALVLMAGDATFHMYAGVIVIDGNRLRFKVRDWKTMIVLKTLRTKLRDVMARLFRAPGKELGDRSRRWMEILQIILDRQQKPLPVAAAALPLRTGRT